MVLLPIQDRKKSIFPLPSLFNFTYHFWYIIHQLRSYLFHKILSVFATLWLSELSFTCAVLLLERYSKSLINGYIIQLKTFPQNNPLICLCTSGVKSVLVGLLAQKAEVKFAKEAITEDEIVCHVREMGFGCELMDKKGQGENTVEILVSSLFWNDRCIKLSCLVIKQTNYVCGPETSGTCPSVFDQS